jgi:putative nucleotidyltransferase with HDIG domain
VGDEPIDDARHWHARPAQAFLVRSAVFAIPVIVSIGVGVIVSKTLPHPESRLQVVLWWIAVMVASTAGLFAADKLARRLLPLATLMRLSMLFPDNAPSRLKVARRFAGSRAIARELEAAHHHGVTGNRQEAAETILALVGALGEYDSRTRGHSERTQLYVTMLADELGLKAEDRGRLMWAALVHDIGKLKVPHEVLNKPGKPTEEEWHVLHSHPVQGANICEPLREWLGEWWLAIEQHHEKFDGSGYPRGLAGKDISYGARIVAVADSYEVMTAARAYKRPMTADAAKRELIRCAGTHFDPDVVRAFLNLSLGEMSRLSGPLAWIAQLLLIRPGPLMGQALGAGASAAVTAASVGALSLAPALAGTVDHAVDGPSAPAHSTGAGDPSTPGDPAATTGDSPSTPTSTGSTSSSPTSPGATTPAAPTTPSTSTTPADGPTTGPVTPTSSGQPSTTPSSGPTTPTPTTPVPVPLDVKDDALTTAEDQPATVDVAANDTADGQVVVVSVGRAGHGTATLSGAGVVHYAPDRNYHGDDSLTYTARDSEGHTDEGTVSVTVTSVNDAPNAADDTLRVAEDSGSSDLSLLGNDSDPDGDHLTVTSVSDPNHGSVKQTADGYAYRPADDYNGPDHMTYTVSDGQGGTTTAALSVDVTPVNDAPIVGPAAYAATVGRRLSVNAANGVLANASDIEGDHLTVVSDDSPAIDIAADGSFAYTPLLVGQRTVSFRVSDGKDTTMGTMTITVTLLAVSVDDLYLQPADTDEVGALDTTAPGGGVSDWDRDGKPGLTIRKSDLKETERDPRKFQTWSYAAPAGGLSLNGPVTLDLWTTPEGHARQDMKYSAWVYECASGGGSCTQLLATGRVQVDNWSTTTTWEERQITLGSITATVQKDNLLQVRLMFDNRDIWMPLDSAHPSKLSLTTS